MQSLRETSGQRDWFFEFAPDACFLFDPDGNFIDANGAAEELVGHSRQRLVGQNILLLRLLDRIDAGHLASLLANLSEGEKSDAIKLVFTPPDRKPVPVEIRAQSIAIDGQVVVMGIARTITDPVIANATLNRRAVDSDLSRCNLELQQQVSERTAELSESIDQLRAEIQQRCNFKEKEDWLTKPIAEANQGVAKKDAIQDVNDPTFAERTVHESEERFRTIFDSEPECVKLLDRDGCLIDMNPAGLAMVEANTLEEVHGQCIYPVVVPEHRARFIAANENSFLGQSATIQFQIIGLRGTKRWMDSHVVPLRDSDGEIIASLSVTRDFTEKKETDKQLHLTQFVVDTAVDGVFLVRPEDGRILYVNQSACKSLGYSRDELLELSVPDVSDTIAVDDWAAFSEALVKSTTISRESAHVRKDGETFPVEIVASYLNFDGVDFIYAQVRDITVRKQAEKSIADSRRFIEAVAEASPYFIYVVDVETLELTYINRSIASDLGVEGNLTPPSTVAELLQLMSEEDQQLQESVVDQWKRMKVGEVREDEYNLFSADGTIRSYLSRETVFATSQDDKVRQIVGTSVDITDRKRAESALRSVVEGIARTVGDDFTLSLVRNLATAFGFRYVLLSEFTDSAMSRVKSIAAWANGELVDSFEYELAGTPCAKVALGSACRYQDDVQELFPDDHLLVELGVQGYLGVPLFGSGGQVIGLLTIMDTRPLITHPEMEQMIEVFATRAASEMERKRFEVDLRASQELFRSILDSLPQYVLWKDTAGRFLGCNQTAAEFTGFDTPEDLVGKTDFDMMCTQADATHYTEFDRRVIESDTAEYHVCERLHMPDGNVRWLDTTKIPLHDSDGNVMGILVVVDDITDRKHSEDEKRRLQVQLQHTQKMDAIGQLASGVAHEFNNLLVAIRGNAELLLLSSGEGLSERARRSLKEIERGCERASTLTQQLLSFARKKDPQWSVVDVNQLVTSNEPMLRRLVGQRIELILQLSKRKLLVHADESELDQVLLNLVLNARDAMKNGGTLIIETDIDRPDKVSGKLTSDPLVRLSVTDDGCGMSDEAIGRAFEPFFTTKPTGKGTGLGLSTVYSDIARCNGFVTIRSVETEGTVIDIYLPLSDERPPAKEAVEEKNVGGGETILVCDDEEIVLSAVSALLECVGYKVIGARNAREALRMADKHRGEISLLLTDVTMPEMDGFALGRLMGQQHPEIKIIYSSGFTADRTTASDLGDIEFLTKGTSSRDMLDRVRKVLDRGVY